MDDDDNNDMMLRMKKLTVLPWMSFLFLEKQEDTFFSFYNERKAENKIDGRRQFLEGRIEKKVTSDEWIEMKGFLTKKKMKTANNVN